MCCYVREFYACNAMRSYLYLTHAGNIDQILQHLVDKELAVVEPLVSTVSGSNKENPRMMKL
jgi:hypothetical protein